MKRFLIIISILFALSINVFAAGGGGGGGGGGSSGGSSGGSGGDSTSSGTTIDNINIGNLACAEDTWKCDEWTSCQEDGKQRRNCTLTNNCSTVSTPPPEAEQACFGLKCGNLPTLAERITCRLQLTEGELNNELNILYFPEYCKVEETPAEKQECIALYKSFGECWQIPWNQPNGKERLNCARRILNFSSVSKEKASCLKKKGSVRKSCLRELKEKRENLTLFKMYEFEQRAEDLLKQGKLALDEVAAFDLFVETKKRDVDKEKSVSAWNALLKKVRAQWDQLSKMR